VWTLAEVALAIEAFGDQVRKVKAAFRGAEVTAVRQRPLNIGTTTPAQNAGANKRATRIRRFAGGRWPSVAGEMSRSPLFDTPPAKTPVDWERGDEIPF
jgi:hypothetical protein